MRKFKTTFVAELYNMIKEDLSWMKKSGSTYVKEMKKDSDVQTLCGQLLVEKLVANNLYKLCNDISKHHGNYIRVHSKEFERNFKTRGLDKYWTFNEFNPTGLNENTAWEKGYLAWLQDWFNSIEFLIHFDKEQLLSLIKY